MRSKSDHAWNMAAQCAKLAQQAEQKDEHDFFIRMRDCWITIANRFAFLDVVDGHGTPIPLSPHIPYPVSRSLERRRVRLRAAERCRSLHARVYECRRAVTASNRVNGRHTPDLHFRFANVLQSVLAS